MHRMGKRILTLILAAIMVLLMVPAVSFASNSTSKFSTPYKSSKYYTQLMNAKKHFGADRAANLVAVAESQLGYKEGRAYQDLNGTRPSGTIKLSYWDTSAKKYKNYDGSLDTCEYMFWYNGCSDNSKVTLYTSTTKKVKNAAFPVSNYNKAWCAAFVSWCSAQAGVTDLIHKSAGATNIYHETINNKGGRVVSASERQPGDLVFYYAAKCPNKKNGKAYQHSTHIGIVSSNPRYSIEGNTQDSVYKVDLNKSPSGTCTCGAKVSRVYVRPAYCTHKNTYSKVTKTATCKANGVKTYYCKSCNAQVKTESIAKTAHKYDKYSHCTVCGIFYPLKAETVKTGVYVTAKSTPLHTSPYDKGLGGKSNTSLTIAKGSVVIVEKGGKNKAGNLWYQVNYKDSKGKVTAGYIYNKYLKLKQDSFAFYEGISKLQTVKYGGKLTIPKTSKETKKGYTLEGFNIYKKVLGKSAQYYTQEGQWVTAAEAKKLGYTYRLYKPGETYTLTHAWMDGNNKSTTKYYMVPKWTKTSAKTYKVSYNANGGSNAPAAQTKTHGKTLTLTTKIPTRSGYVFKGWATTAKGAVVYAKGGAFTTDKAVTLYAVWEKIPITWKTLYVKNIKATSALIGCDVTSDTSKLKNIGLQLRTAGGAWKTVVTWKTSSKLTYCTVQCGGSGAEAPALKANTTYEYRFFVTTTNVGTQYSSVKSFKTAAAATTTKPAATPTPAPATYKVSYNANGGSGAPAAQTKTQGKTLTLTTAIPTRSGYVFKGWATTAAGAVVYAKGGAYTTDKAVTLYAVWEKIPITWNTLYVKNIKATSALIGTTVTSDCSKLTNIGLQLRTAGGSWKTVASWKTNKVLTYCTVQCGGSGAEAPALKANTTYEYRFFVTTTNVGTQYSSVKSFKTTK